jgi:ankyrin repeat protein
MYACLYLYILKTGKTALYWAAFYAHDAIVNLLLNKGAKIEAKNMVNHI